MTPRFLYRDGFWKAISVALLLGFIVGFRALLKPIVNAVPVEVLGYFLTALLCLSIGFLFGRRDGLKEAGAWVSGPRFRDRLRKNWMVWIGGFGLIVGFLILGAIALLLIALGWLWITGQLAAA